MKRPLADKRPIGPFSEIIGGTTTGSSSGDEFDGMFESFTVVLDYEIVADSLQSESDIEKEAYNIAEVLNDYLFSNTGPLYFMRAEKGKGQVNSFRLMYGIDGDIWEGRLDREGKHEGSIAGTEDVVNANLGPGKAVDRSYMHIYPTEVAKEIQETGTFERV